MNNHIPVLLHQAVDALVVDRDGAYLDATFGRGGHSREILTRLTAKGKLYSFDKDPEALIAGRNLQEQDSRLSLFHDDFVSSPRVLADRGVCQLNGALFDLGVSANQLCNASRGFSFQHDGVLDMRMDNSQGQTVAQWLAKASLSEIVKVLRDYGEERYAVSIARAIIDYRSSNPLKSTLQLAEIIASARPAGKFWKKHPATKSFQAFRIYINNELNSLSEVLGSIVDMLVVGGRLVVISFHSLEDRIVKRFIAGQTGSRAPVSVPTMRWLIAPVLTSLNRLKPDAEEIELNPSSRSAVMRVAEKLPVRVS